MVNEIERLSNSSGSIFRASPRRLASSRKVKIEPYHATRCGSHWSFFRKYSTQGRGQTQQLEQFRSTRNLFLCGDCFLGELFGLRSDLLPNTAFQHERKRCQSIHVAHLWIPFAAFEHRAAPETGERGRIDRWFYPQVAGFFATDRKLG